MFVSGFRWVLFLFWATIIQLESLLEFQLSTSGSSILPLLITIHTHFFALLQQEVSPRTSGRLSHSSGPLNGSLTDSPPVSPSENDDVKVGL